MYILRGRKTLSSSVFLTPDELQAHAESEDDIRGILDSYGVEFVVVESTVEPRAHQIHHTLRDFLGHGPFELKTEIPVRTSARIKQGQTLRIYRYLDSPPITADHIEIRLPAVGQTVKAPIRNLKPEREMDDAHDE